MNFLVLLNQSIKLSIEVNHHIPQRMDADNSCCLSALTSFLVTLSLGMEESPQYSPLTPVSAKDWSEVLLYPLSGFAAIPGDKICSLLRA